MVRRGNEIENDTVPRHSHSLLSHFALSFNTPTCTCVSLYVAITASPVNDKFATRSLLAGTSGSVTGSTLRATVEAGEPEVTSEHTVWYKISFTTTGTLSLTVTPTLSTYRPFVSLLNDLDGTIGHLEPVGVSANCPTSCVTFPRIVAGKSYVIAIGGQVATDRGAFTLRWRLQ